MTVPTPSFGPDGFIVPPESTVLPAVKDEINQAFGGNLNMADETPQGQIAVSQTAAIGNANDAFAFLSQQFDPAYASGRYQDALARIYYISRIGARPTSVICTCSGSEGVMIPAGSLALASTGQTYASTEDAVIGFSGTVDVNFACTTLGAIPCPVGTVTTIYQAINGWDSITNAGEGALGRETETRSEFEARRFDSVSKNSRGSLPSVRAAILELDGVLDCYVTENVESSPVTVRGALLGPKTLYAAVVGGDAAQIADAIWRKKAPGCGYNGNVNVTVYDTNAGYDPPYPAYSVAFERPDALPILFAVDLQSNPSIPANAEALIDAAILAAFTGQDGGSRVRIGAEIFAARFYAAILMLGPWAQLRAVKIGSNQDPDATATGSISGANMTISAMSTGAIQIGGTVSGSGINDGTRIVSQTSGTPGGIGVYVLNNSQTVPTTAMTMASTNRDTIFPDIDLTPAYVAANVKVTIS